MMKKSKKIFGIVMTVCILLGTSIAAHAADPYLNWGYETAHPSVQSYSNKYNSTWLSILNNSIGAWNNSSAVVTIGTSSSSSNILEAAQYNDSWYGLSTPIVSDGSGNVSQFSVKANARTISKSATNFSNFAQSVIVHEFGHIFWLLDNPVTSKTTIMNYNRDRNTMITPQQFDIDNVNAKY